MMIIISVKAHGYFVMQVIASRKYTFLDSQTLSEELARDTLIKVGENDFALHMASEAS